MTKPVGSSLSSSSSSIACGLDNGLKFFGILGVLVLADEELFGWAARPVSVR